MKCDLNSRKKEKNIRREEEGDENEAVDVEEEKEVK